MLLEQLRPNSRYNFRLHGAAHVGAEVKRATLMAVGSLAFASVIDAGLAAKHIQVYPSLPAGVPKDPSKLTYLIFTTEANQTVVYAYNWLIESSIEASTVNKATVEVRISAAEDVARIVSILSNAGFTVESSIAG